jgi:hypothetical protein
MFMLTVSTLNLPLVIGASIGAFLALLIFILSAKVYDKEKANSKSILFVFIGLLFFASDLSSFAELAPIAHLRDIFISMVVFFCLSIVLNLAIALAETFTYDDLKRWSPSGEKPSSS